MNGFHLFFSYTKHCGRGNSIKDECRETCFWTRCFRHSYSLPQYFSVLLQTPQQAFPHVSMFFQTLETLQPRHYLGLILKIEPICESCGRTRSAPRGALLYIKTRPSFVHLLSPYVFFCLQSTWNNRKSFFFSSQYHLQLGR
jgi:hypothetical protein